MPGAQNTKNGRQSTPKSLKEILMRKKIMFFGVTAP
jgi:hypothetical protein